MATYVALWEVMHRQLCTLDRGAFDEEGVEVILVPHGTLNVARIPVLLQRAEIWQVGLSYHRNRY